MNHPENWQQDEEKHNTIQKMYVLDTTIRKQTQRA